MKTKDQKLEALSNAVDDYLYSEVADGGYPEGHCNPRYLEVLRQVFLAAATPSGNVTKKENSAVHHPDHYNQHPTGVECIDIIEHFNFNIGVTIKHLWRAGLKGGALEDLQKAAWYLQREIERVKKETLHEP